jgi:hypothetical protein
MRGEYIFRRKRRFDLTRVRYVMGYGADFVGIWDRVAKGTPVKKFPKTSEGQRAATKTWGQLVR